MTNPAPAVLDPVSVVLTEAEFAWFTRFLQALTGIELKDGKQNLVMGRLARRLRHYGFDSYSQYFELLGQANSPAETRVAIDLMTTNETFFFREPQHFELLPSLLQQRRSPNTPARIWSAASSTGEEAYSAALALSNSMPELAWQIHGTDVSMQVLATAKRALYPLEAAERIPVVLRRAYCLKGKGENEGLFTIKADIRSKVSFSRANLTRPLPELGMFDVVFLRNVMIYFSAETKRVVVERVCSVLRPGGVLLIGHAETLTGIPTELTLIKPSVYQKQPA